MYRYRKRLLENKHESSGRILWNLQATRRAQLLSNSWLETLLYTCSSIEELRRIHGTVRIAVKCIGPWRGLKLQCKATHHEGLSKMMGERGIARQSNTIKQLASYSCRRTP
jgi:hypothetical protein